MHGTRTTVRILTGVAMAALAGCIAVEQPPVAPAPVPGPAAERQDPDVAPQIVQGPAREALEAAMPDPPTPEPRSSVERQRATGGGQGGHERRTDDGPSRPEKKPHPPAGTRHKPRHPVVELPELPRPPRSAAELCELGAKYGGWSPNSEQAKACRATYGR